MRFHISSHHTPNNCAVHRGDGTAPVTNWPERCKQIGVEFVAGGGFNSSHLSFMFVETDDSIGGKFTSLKTPIWLTECEDIDNRTPPILGQNNREILTGLGGLTESELDSLENEGAV